MTAEPLISIVTRTKDRTLFLRRAIEDVLRQEYLNWELLIVNDGDAQCVETALSGFEEELAGRASVLDTGGDKGMEFASNLALGVARGKYTAIHDDDDTWHPTFLQRTSSHLETHSEVQGVAVRTEIVYERLDGDKIVEISREPAWADVDRFSLSRLFESNIAVPISCLYRTQEIRELGGFREDLPVVGDWEFHLRLAVNGAVDFLDGVALAYWHQRPQLGGAYGNSVTARAASHRFYDSVVRDDEIQKFSARWGIAPFLYSARENDKTRAEVRELRRILEEREPEEAPDAPRHTWALAGSAVVGVAVGLIARSGVELVKRLRS